MQVQVFAYSYELETKRCVLGTNVFAKTSTKEPSRSSGTKGSCLHKERSRRCQRMHQLSRARVAVKEAGVMKIGAKEKRTKTRSVFDTKTPNREVSGMRRSGGRCRSKGLTDHAPTAHYPSGYNQLLSFFTRMSNPGRFSEHFRFFITEIFVCSVTPEKNL